MSYRVVVWGTGNVGRPAIRAVHGHRDLELVGVVVHDPAKVGVDAGELANMEPLAVAADDDIGIASAGDVDAVVYTVNADFRPEESLAEVEAVLRSGTDVVSTSFYPFLHPASTPGDIRRRIEDACHEGRTSLFVSGIDPGWVMDILPLMLTSVSCSVTEIRIQEIFNYALYDQPDAVRNLCGFGMAMDQEPPMLYDFSLQMVWAPMVRILADGLGRSIDEVRTEVERRPLERTVEVPGMGEFLAGTQGAFRFEVQGIIGGEPRLVVEHITRIDDACAPDWPLPPTGQGLHRVQMVGHPNLSVDVHGTEPGEPGAAGGGNATAANRVVNAIPAVCQADAGLVDPLALASLDPAAVLGF